MHTRIESSDYCAVCNDIWCTNNHDFVIVFGSSLWSDTPNDIDVLYTEGVSPSKARQLAETWAKERNLQAPIELHQGRSGTIWSPPGKPQYELLLGDSAIVPVMRNWNTQALCLPLLSSLLRRYPWYGWCGHECAIVLDTSKDRVQLKEGLRVSGFSVAPWQQYLDGDRPTKGLRTAEGWIIDLKVLQAQ